jgi:tRNA 2-thiocytidine biosynthesis protein TtcA
MGFEEKTSAPVAEFLKKQGFPFYMEETDFGPYAHSSENRNKSICFICSMLRRKRLFELASALSCNKIALGHNQDDLIETFFLNLLYVGELSTMIPRQKMFEGLITLIRPLAYVEKTKIQRLAKELRLPVIKNPCPSAQKGKRQEIKNMLNGLFRTNRKIRGNIMRAMSHARTDYLLKDMKRTGRKKEEKVEKT